MTSYHIENIDEYRNDKKKPKRNSGVTNYNYWNEKFTWKNQQHIWAIEQWTQR